MLPVAATGLMANRRGTKEMRILIRADDGDQIAIDADDLATEQQIVRLEFSNLSFQEQEETDSIALTTARARELASALLAIADAVDGVQHGQTAMFGASLSALRARLPG